MHLHLPCTACHNGRVLPKPMGLANMDAVVQSCKHVRIALDHSVAMPEEYEQSARIVCAQTHVPSYATWR